ncbi:helix-turn-helix domain-containing protein [Mesoflavibacter sp. SCSIO 43206]|uniref:AlbA family DNA-binding domain-containing protein n=1 Tax=Mesoflavibacter sp. SCSIO 43206 TaxID=2779362 RepID=UPI001CA9C190|nr:helix-turn-helix domain-containing protein [Mesoflavibacter sp. SCSIO 43206]UAB74528.1 putative DNA binding domain-containing protein [Mesoflavibacter sp. SCSIO 43206]
MITDKDIKSIAASGEGYNAEFKVRLPKKIKEVTEEICAFANASGGTLLIGVDDDNVIQGCTIDNAKRSAIQNSIREIKPALNCEIYSVDVDGKEIWVIEVPSGTQKPYALSGAIYVRIGPNSQKVTEIEEMRDFFQQADRIYFDETPCPAFDIATGIHAENLKEFKAEANLSSAVPNEQIFKNLKLQDQKNAFKNGAVLFFGKEPQQYIDTALIRCVAFDGKDKRYIVDDKKFTGPLYVQYKDAIQWLKNKLDVRYEIEGSTGPREEVWEIPQTVFKEAIVNALAHRDYYDRGATITIELFDDRVEIANPGGLVSAVSSKDFGKRSHSRNPLVFGLFARMRMVEQIGSGIGRIKDLMKENDLQPPHFSFDGMFTVTLTRPFDFEKWIARWEKHLTDNRLEILRAVNENSKVTIGELASKIGISDTAIGKNIDVLKELGLLDREGTKGGNWKLLHILPENDDGVGKSGW